MSAVAPAVPYAVRTSQTPQISGVALVPEGGQQAQTVVDQGIHAAAHGELADRKDSVLLRAIGTEELQERIMRDQPHWFDRACRARGVTVPKGLNSLGELRERKAYLLREAPQLPALSQSEHPAVTTLRQLKDHLDEVDPQLCNEHAHWLGGQIALALIRKRQCKLIKAGLIFALPTMGMGLLVAYVMACHLELKAEKLGRFFQGLLQLGLLTRGRDDLTRVLNDSSTYDVHIPFYTLGTTCYGDPRIEPRIPGWLLGAGNKMFLDTPISPEVAQRIVTTLCQKKIEEARVKSAALLVQAETQRVADLTLMTSALNAIQGYTIEEYLEDPQNLLHVFSHVYPEILNEQIGECNKRITALEQMIRELDAQCIVDLRAFEGDPSGAKSIQDTYDALIADNRTAIEKIREQDIKSRQDDLNACAKIKANIEQQIGVLTSERKKMDILSRLQQRISGNQNQLQQIQGQIQEINSRRDAVKAALRYYVRLVAPRLEAEREVARLAG